MIYILNKPHSHKGSTLGLLGKEEELRGISPRINRYPVKSLVKALVILETLAENPGGCGITQLSSTLKIRKSTVHRLLATLRQKGYVLIDPATSRYILGGMIAALGQQVSHQSPLLRFGTPTVEKLAQECNETVHVGTLEGTEIVYLTTAESREALRISFRAGHRLPAHSTALGKACLSSFSDQEVLSLYQNSSRLPKLTSNTLNSVESLLTELSAVRRAGAAYDHEESCLGVCCVAVPVREFSGKGIAALSVSVPKLRMIPERERFFKQALLTASAELSERLGFTERRPPKVAARVT